ncbi:unnamed protein product, partial [Mesorhabditis belari]|uniref:RNA helicase n=1 Tax=Mesorhabditis belari TaxID=2138241 RepID=A0AAF3E860_9BILA
MDRHEFAAPGGTSTSGGGSRRTFLKPSDDHRPRTGPLVMEERGGKAVSGEEGTVFYNNPYTGMAIRSQRARLPIAKNRNHILYALEKYQTLIVVGETGCGKSTQVPQYLLEAGWCADGRMVGVTQPRRVAAITLAARVAEEVDTLLGQDVGYIVRFDDATDNETKIKYMTDGILLREMFTDPLLSKYSVLMVDEAHERTTNTDILLGLLRRIITVRSDLRVVISSATLDAELFRNFFELNETNDQEKNTSTIISVEGRTHPVTVLYTKTSVPSYLTTTVETVLKIHQDEMPGDILAFLTGQDEVEEVCKKIREQSVRLKNCDKLWVVPCYGSLPPREQMKAFESTPHGTRKVVIATNIAETSVTIPGIAYVIDCGYVKLRALNPKNGIETLMKIPISRSSAEQRAGRAGRIRPGKAYRLYPEEQFAKLPQSTVPEIQRCDLAPTILQMKALGIQNIHRFHYLSRPPSASVICAFELLYALGAVDIKCLLTNPLGIQISEFPLPPMHSKCLLNSGHEDFTCSEEMATIIAMLQIQDIFITPSGGGGARHRADVSRRKFSVEEGDHLTYLNVYTSYVDHKRSKSWCDENFLNYRGLKRADAVRAQLVALMKRFGVRMLSSRGDIGATERITRCLVTGFFSQAARYHYTGKYLTVKEDYPFSVYKGSAVMFSSDYPKWVIFTEVLADSIRDITVVDPQWLYELAPHYYEFGTDNEIAKKRARKGNEDNENNSDEDSS